MRDRLLQISARLAERHPALLLGFALIITGLAAGLSGDLRLEMHFKNLMPQNHPMVIEFNRIIDDFSTASMIIVAARGDETELKAFAETLVPQIRAQKADIQRVDYKIEREFFLRHGFMLQKAKDLDKSKTVYSDLNLVVWLKHVNDTFEKTYVYEEESISTREKENNAIAFLDGIQYWLTTMQTCIDAGDGLHAKDARFAAERFLIGDEYFISQDKDMLLVLARPTFSLNEIDRVIEVENSIDALIQKIAAQYPSVDAGTTGTMALTRDETVAASEDMHVTSIIAFVLIIVMFILSFRMWIAPLLAGISLLTGIIWTMGFAALTLGSLNIMTSMFAVILIGLGVDFSIHIITGYTENRAAGKAIGVALEETLLKSGRGVITGGLTTACAFLTLTISETAGMREFGIVSGFGVLFCMIATILVLPAMLASRDRLLIKIRKDRYVSRSTEFVFLGRLATSLAKRPLIVLSAAGVVTLILLYSAARITFDYNYLNMEPVGLTSIRLQDEMEKEFDVTPDFALVTASSVEHAREIAEQAKGLKMVGMVMSISEYIPSPEQQKKRVEVIEQIRADLLSAGPAGPVAREDIKKLHTELYRLEDNIIELAQLAYLGGQDKVDKKCKAVVGDPEETQRKSMVLALIADLPPDGSAAIDNVNFFHSHFSGYFKELALSMTSIEPINIDNLPLNIRDQFISKAGDKFLVSIYPKEGVWKNLEFLQRFTSRMDKIDPRVTGIPSVFYILTDIIAQDGRNAFMLTLAVIFLLLWWDFKKVRLALMAMLPLLLGAIWMVGIMQISGLQLTMVNVLGLPLILGIGIDDGVHILHRYRSEGKGRLATVFTSTGKAVMLTSVTTMLAFGSLVFATYRGLGSLGIALFIGVATCFLTSIFILPAMLSLYAKTSGNMAEKQ
jgi:hopanoid biosynthesis associated RND transporter like protein HpnN